MTDFLSAVENITTFQYILLFFVTILVIFFHFFVKTEQRKNKLCNNYLKNYRALLKESNDTLSELIFLCERSDPRLPIDHPRVQSLLVKEQACVHDMIDMIDNVPDELKDGSATSEENRQKLLEERAELKRLILYVHNN